MPDPSNPCLVIVELPSKQRLTVSGRVAQVISDLARFADFYNEAELKGQMVWNFKDRSVVRECHAEID